MEEWEATVDALLETAPMPRTDDEIDAFGKLITAFAWRKSGKLRTEGRAIGTIRKNMLVLTNGAGAGSAQGPACFKNDKEKWTAIVDVYRKRCMELSEQGGARFLGVRASQ